jgi:hypothetical protein
MLLSAWSAELLNRLVVTRAHAPRHAPPGWSENTPIICSGATARAGNRRFSRFGALRAHTKAS